MKGVVAQPMPKRWYNEKAAADSDSSLDTIICASKKPYFMIYRYPEHRARYLAFHNVARKRCALLFGVHLEELGSVPQTEQINTFREWYDRLCPVQKSKGVVNRICAVCEEYFNSLRPATDEVKKFNPDLLKSGMVYSSYTKNKVATLCHEYMWALKQAGASQMPEDELTDYKQLLAEEFALACAAVCPDENELCDIVVDMCYARENSKQFAWDICGERMVKNVLEKTGGEIYYPRAARQGSIVYGGKRYQLEKLKLERTEDERYCS